MVQRSALDRHPYGGVIGKSPRLKRPPYSGDPGVPPLFCGLDGGLDLDPRGLVAHDHAGWSSRQPCDSTALCTNAADNSALSIGRTSQPTILRL
jgi:hypothetical protein